MLLLIQSTAKLLIHHLPTAFGPNASKKEILCDISSAVCEEGAVVHLVSHGAVSLAGLGCEMEFATCTAQTLREMRRP